MLVNKIKEKICLFLAAAVFSTAGIYGFAEGATPLARSEIKDEQQDTTAETPINISVNYFENGEKSYLVKFSSLDALESIKDINFKIIFTGADVKYPEFDAALKNSSSEEGVVGSDTAKFEHGAYETAISGKAPLCSVTLVNADAPPTAETVLISDFTAVDGQNNTITYKPTLEVKEGPVVPELSENAQMAYDLITTLPASGDISFYNGDDLYDISELDRDLKDAAQAFDELTKEEVEDLDAVLRYNMKNRDALETLPHLVSSMKSAYPVIRFASLIAPIGKADLLGYRFIPMVYDKIKNDISISGFPSGVKVLSEYQVAKNIITSKATEIEAAYSSSEYEDKIEAITTQLERANKLSSDTYYLKYIDVILVQANDLLHDVETNYDGNYKDYMIADIEEVIDRIELVQKGIGEVPKMSTNLKTVAIGSQYAIDFERTKESAVDAQIEIKVYLESDLKNEIDSDKFNFKAGSTTLKATMRAFSSRGYEEGENVVLDSYYIVDGATLSIGKLTLKCRKSTDPMHNASGIPVDKDDEDDSSQSGGTKFPSANDDDYDDDKNDNNEKPVPELFSDIKNYGWAKEAIEGLYYAGIINGMEEGIFNPSGSVTREQFCKMTVQLFGVLQYDTETEFDDVAPNAWYAQYINSAILAGYVQGQSPSYFGIGESIMRQDMAVMLYRALGSQNSAAVLDFTDADNIAPYAKEAVSELVGLGIITGYEDGTFNPRGTATRAEAAKMIWGVYNIIND